MDKDREKQLITESNKLINKFILRGERFVCYACFQFGKLHAQINGKPNSRFTDDFQYFVFTKSTKSLVSIRLLLKENKNEDVLIILRSMFEGYLASRFIVEEYDESLLNDFLFIPTLISERIIIHNKDGTKNRKGQQFKFEQRNPSELKLGKDKDYCYDFYGYLCNYAHCNYSILSCYLGEHEEFTCNKETDSLLIRLFVLFVYSKIFECIVTVDGEDFPNDRTEKDCYKLLKDTIVFLYNTLEEYKNTLSSENKYFNKYIKNMLKCMKKSLKEEIGSQKKDYLK